MPIRSRSSTRQPPRAIPVAETEAPRARGAQDEVEVRRAIPVEPRLWRPKVRRASRPTPEAAGTPAADAKPGARPGFWARLLKPATRAAGSSRASAKDGAPVERYGKYQSLSQLDYPQTRLGNGNKTIATHGCFLTSMTMAATGLTGRTLDPAQANTLVRNGKGFAGGGLEAPLAAKALGMKLVERSAVSDGNAAALRGKLDGWLASGRPVVAGVDLHDGRSTGTRGSDADHFILLVDKNADGSYTALDPLGGRQLTLRVNDAGRLVTPRVVAGDRPYRVDELAFLDARPTTR
jgi:hypothetical protein